MAGYPKGNTDVVASIPLSSGIKAIHGIPGENNGSAKVEYLQNSSRFENFFKPGDHIAVRPTNDVELSHSVLAFLETSPRQKVALEIPGQGAFETTLGEALKSHVDITAQPRASFWEKVLEVLVVGDVETASTVETLKNLCVEKDKARTQMALTIQKAARRPRTVQDAMERALLEVLEMPLGRAIQSKWVRKLQWTTTRFLAVAPLMQKSVLFYLFRFHFSFIKIIPF